MATSAEHAAAFAAYVVRTQNPQLTEPLEPEKLRAEVHTILSTKAGTGSDYEAADTALATAGTNLVKLHTAKLIAIKAE
ncbi:hypothetical protein [Microbacterium sp. Leaf179]|uniref:hypothetical protein n=1 Tax=Microbacterium sp. Leaf179 TaxID=1736288 RepID=UPI0006F91D03|nr:hypothetical protein [Microbacterium sp. Leaf179]KQR86738.1 hypothetical protein ASF96_10480 [Microbacterium sp. Leaf179]